MKDVWYRINDAHHRYTKKYSTMILLRNFYVGITNWYRYVLDTLTGGNFLGAPALEASYIIKNLVGIPPINDIKIEITPEDVMKKLESIEKILNFLDKISKVEKLLDSTSKFNESLRNINERINILETGTIQSSQKLRIDELE